MSPANRAIYNFEQAARDMQPGLKKLGDAFTAAGVASLRGLTLAIEKEKARNPAFARSMAALSEKPKRRR